MIFYTENIVKSRFRSVLSVYSIFMYFRYLEYIGDVAIITGEFDIFKNYSLQVYSILRCCISGKLISSVYRTLSLFSVYRFVDQK